MCFSKVTGFYLCFLYHFIYYPKKLNGWQKKPTLEHNPSFQKMSQFFLDIFVLICDDKKKSKSQHMKLAKKSVFRAVPPGNAPGLQLCAHN